MADFLRRIAEASWFQNFIIVVILLAGVVVGLETYPEIVEKHGRLLKILDATILAIFVIEIAIKMGAEGRRPLRYFRDGWNVFDFVIVAGALIPFLHQYAMVLRMLRLLRVLRLVRAIPRLQILVNALLRSIPSMFYVSLLLIMLFYMYAVAGVFLFAKNDPVHFGNLQLALLSLFRIVTLEDWTDIMYTQMYGCDIFGFGTMEELCTNPQAFPLLSPFYFVTFVLLGTMIALNLFIGVIVNGMEEARTEEEIERMRQNHVPPPTLEEELFQMRTLLRELDQQVRRVEKTAEKEKELTRDALAQAEAGDAP